MNEFIEKLIGRLEEKSVEITFPLYPDDSTSFVPITEAIQIVNQLAEEYNNGWIPCIERLPEDCTIYEVTARFGNGMCYTEFAYYDESKGEWWKHDEDGLVNVLAWKEHSAPYQPKGE